MLRAHTESVSGLEVHFARTIRHPTPQIRSIGHIQVTQRYTNTNLSHSAVSHRTGFIPSAWQVSHTHNNSNRDRQAVRLPCDGPSSISSPPEPNSSVLAVIFAPFIFLGSIGTIIYGCRRFLNPERGTLKVMRGRWTDATFALTRVSGSQLFDVISKALVAVAHSLDEAALLDSIKSYVRSLPQRLEAHKLCAYITISQTIAKPYRPWWKELSA